MVPSGASLCFTCGHPVGEPPRLNPLASGEPCPTCAERLLESIPAALPGGGGLARPAHETSRDGIEIEQEIEGGSWQARYLRGGGEAPFDDDPPEPA